MLLLKVFSLSIWQGRKKVREKQKQMRIAKQALKGKAVNNFYDSVPNYLTVLKLLQLQ